MVISHIFKNSFLFVIIISFIFSDNTVTNDNFDTAFHFYNNAEWDSAQFYFNETIIQNDLKISPELTITAYRNIGNSLIRKHKLEEAKQPLEQSIFYAKKYLGESNQYIVKAMNSLAVISSIKGESNNAISYFKQIIQIQMNVDSTKYNLLGKLYNNIANNYNDLNNFDSAIKNYKVALFYKEKTFGKGSPKLAVTYNNIGTIYHNMGNHDESIHYFKFALQYKDDSYAPSSLAKIYKNMALSLTKMNDFELAKSYILKAIEIENLSESYTHFSNLGNIYNSLNNHNKAITSFSRSLFIIDSLKIDDPSHYANVMNNLGVTYLNLKDTTTAKNYFNKSINIYKSKAKLSHLNRYPYYNLAKCHLENNPDKAREYAWKIIALADSLYDKNNAIKVDGYNMLATIESAHKNYVRANEYYQLAINENQGYTNILNEDSYFHVLSRSSLIDTYIGQIDVVESQKLFANNIETKIQYLNSIIKLSQKSIELIEFIRDRIKFSDSKYKLMEYSQKVFDSALHATYELYSINTSEQLVIDFLNLAEKNHHSVLKSSLQDIQAHDFSDIPIDVFKKEQELRSEITSLENKILESNGQSTSNESLTNKTIEYDDYIRKLEKEYPNYYALKYTRLLLDVNTIYKHINDESLIIEFISDSQFYYAITISKEEINITKLSDKNEVDDKLDIFLKSLKKVNKKPFVKYGHEIYVGLFNPILSYLNDKSKLYIIPDGKLSELPFDALITQTPRKKKYNFTDLNYLINTVEINYLVSCTFFNNPSNNIEFESFLGVAPVENFSTHNNVEYNILSQSEFEVSEIQSIFESNNFHSNYLIKNSATETNVKNLSDYKYDVVHFATHGILNREEPKLSALLLHDSDDVNDGILYSNELFNLNLHTELVVLSSCESGSGKFQIGEGILSLMQGIFYAGANNLIYTHWKIDDQITSEFMINFYKELIKTNNLSSSLHNSKLKMIQNKKTANPRSWSGYALISK